MKKSRTSEVVAFCPTVEQWTQVGRGILDGFGVIDPGDEGQRDHLRPESRRIGVASGDEIFGGAFAYEFQMSLPGGAMVPVAGLGGVAISPPFQGNGGLHRIIDLHLEQSRAHGDAGSVLMASESGIYSRYGYGMATEMVEWQLKTLEFSLHNPESISGKVRLIHDTNEALQCVPEIYRGSVQRGSGALQRSADWWAMIIGGDSKTPSWFGGGEQFIAVHYSESGTADAYALYTLAESSGEDTRHGCINYICKVRELVALDMPAQVAMFHYLQSIAWVRELLWDFGPVDPPLRYAMKDPRQLRQRARMDMMWLRPIDLVALLGGRRYHSDGEVLLNYRDPIFSDLSGYYLLKVADGRAQVNHGKDLQSTDAVDLDSSALGRMLLGGTRVVEMARAGIVSGNSDAIRTLDRLLLCDQKPFNLSKF